MVANICVVLASEKFRTENINDSLNITSKSLTIDFLFP